MEFCEAENQFALSERGTMRLYRKVTEAVEVGRFVVALDLRNAFNMLDRSCVKELIEKHFGPGKDFCLKLYSNPSLFRVWGPPGQVQTGGGGSAPAGAEGPVLPFQLEPHGRPQYEFTTQRGVVQGCLVAPLLFAPAVARTF